MAEHFGTAMTGVLERLGVVGGKSRGFVLYNWSRWVTARTSLVARAAAAPGGGRDGGTPLIWLSCRGSVSGSWGTLND